MASHRSLAQSNVAAAMVARLRERGAFVIHFAGTDLVVEHVEQGWCPTISTGQLAGEAPLRFEEDPC